MQPRPKTERRRSWYRFAMARLTMMPAVLGTLLCVSSCSDEGEEDDGDCSAVGDARDCACEDGAPGYQLCLASGDHSACNCRIARLVPCNAPGVAFDCACGDGSPGVEICLASGDYTSCDCAAAGSDVAERARESSRDDAAVARLDAPLDAAMPIDVSTNMGEVEEPAAPAPTACPAGFSCTDQMGVSVCGDETGIPPLCTSAADCVAAGLPAADCIDPMLGGILVCGQPCGS